MYEDIAIVKMAIYNLPLTYTPHNCSLRIKLSQRRTAPARSASVPVLIFRQVECIGGVYTHHVHVLAACRLSGGGWRAAPRVDIVAVLVTVGCSVAIAWV